MCIAAVIFSPIPFHYLHEMDHDNPHGGGVAWADGGELHFQRGLTATDIFTLQEQGVLTYPYLLHFRWATHGAKVPQLTHPFPIGPRALYGELEGTAERVLVHNGVWHGWKAWIPRMRHHVPTELLDAASDTAILAWVAAEHPEVLQDVPWAIAVGSLSPGGELDVETDGTWTDYRGNWYSNLSWLPAKEWWDARHKHEEVAAGRGLSTGTGSSYWKICDDGSWEHHEADPPPVSVQAPAQAKDLDMRDASKFDWDDYVRARYGDEVADGVAEQDEKNPEADPDLLTEDPEAVNAWLARQMLGVG